MKHYVGYGLGALAGLLLAGCPIYPNDFECYDSFDCPNGYFCSSRNICVRPVSGTAGSGGSSSQLCNGPNDCGANMVCGSDARCHSGDCFFSGCVSGYSCVVVDNAYTCVASGTGGSGGSPDGGIGGDDAGTGGQADASTGGTGGGSQTVYCGNPGDCDDGQVCASQGTCQEGTCLEHGCVFGFACDSAPDAGISECKAESAAACIVSDDCVAIGKDYACVDGMCTGLMNLCNDKTQCPSPDTQSCVEGKCTSTCAASSTCADGFLCDTALGVCTEPAAPCAVTNDCGDASMVCVAGACVPRCGTNGSCADAGQVCVANGCVPRQAAASVCTQEGQQDTCEAGSICLYRACYISCTTTSGDTCAANEPGLDVCKTVTTTLGGYQVCGSTTNLGSECNPTGGQGCDNVQVCINGYCR